MKKESPAVQISPLMGMERAFFEEHKEALGAQYAAKIQALAENWEATAETVKALRKKRFRIVRIGTFFGEISFRVRQGIDRKGRWVSPALAFLGIHRNQRYSPDMEQRMAVLAAETGSYEKAATVADATWVTFSDDATRSLVLRLGDIAADHPLAGLRPGAAPPEDLLIVMADGWNARHRGANWGRNKTDRELPERATGTRFAPP